MVKNDDENPSEINEKSSLPRDDIKVAAAVTNDENGSGSSIEKEYKVVEESIRYIENKYEEEDSDIQVVNELATVEDDRTLSCYTLRAFVTGVVCNYYA